MAENKQGQIRTELLDTDKSFDTASSAVNLLQSGQVTAAAEPWQTKFMRGLAHNIHLLTFFPIVLISILSGVNLLLAAVLCTCLVVWIIVVSYCCFRGGHIKVGAVS
jgi:uncharacterized membrane protein